jgi:hypothetical protein
VRRVVSGTLPTTHFYVVSASGGLADVVVSLQGVTAKSTGASRRAGGAGPERLPLFADDSGGADRPEIVVKNSDPCVHNVHTVPKENEEKNLVQMPGGADLNFTFRQAGAVSEIPMRRASVDVRVGHGR